jgi:DNA-binding transcriptional LysR family regulator
LIFRTEPVRDLPSLTLQQLDYLVAVADAPNWAAAAAARGVTPSALSQGLAELERRLGIGLFERDGRRRVLAPGAEEVLAYARRVTADSEDLARWLDRARSGHAGPFRLGMVDAAALGHWPAALQAFRREHEATPLQLSIAPSGELLRHLQANRLDVAVIVAPPEIPPGIEWTELLSDPLAIYAPPGIEPGPPSTWGPWVSFPATSHTRRLIDQRLMFLGARMEVTSESNQPEVLKEMVRLGLGWTVLPVIQAEGEPQPLVRARPEPLLERRLVAIWRSRRLAHPLTQRFIARLVTTSRPDPTGLSAPAARRSDKQADRPGVPLA